MTMTKIKLSNNKEESNLKGYDYEYKNKNIDFTIGCVGDFNKIKSGEYGCYMAGYNNEYDEEIEQSLNIPEGVNSWFQLCEYVVNNICINGVEIEEISAC